MNIQEAKDEIVRTLRAYTAKGPGGEPRIPPEKQRPLLLIGPPGIGKTAIMRQIAQETGAGLVAYTMTHHTRQSAIGLPFISQREYGGRTYSITEYTMSEIVASIYDYMEATGKRSGILFLDEINCVSETLAPVMLQLLQNKTFGNHPLPPDWVIVAAGNPPEYNKSVRELDMATLDRVKHMEISASLPVWQEYARRQGLHPAIRTYLSLYPDHFYNITNTDRGQLFVTARGWEDLSCILLAYEDAGEEVGDEFFLQYLQHDQIARSFGVYYALFRNFGGGDGDFVRQLAHRPDVLRVCTATECMSLAATLFHSVQCKAQDWALHQARLARLGELLSLIPPECDFLDEGAKNAWFAQRREALRVQVEHAVLKPGEELRETWALNRLEKDVLRWLREARSTPFPVWEKGEIEALNRAAEDQASAIIGEIETDYAILEACPQGRSALLYLTADLSGDEDASSLLQGRDCPAWLRWGREVLAEGE